MKVRLHRLRSHGVGMTLGLMIAALLSSKCLMPQAHAGAGDLDPSFGAGGKVITDLGGFDSAHALTLQNDGKIITAGTTGSAFALARYNTNGSLDTDFSRDGKVITDFFSPGGRVEQASAVILQPDGKIVAGGLADSGATGLDFALARYNPDGSPDEDFGIGGKVLTDFLGFNSVEAISALAIQSDGKIVAAGNTSSPRFFLNQVFGLARYNTDGSLDSAFGNGGKAAVSFLDNSSFNETARVIAIQPDGKIVVAGFASDDFAITRLNTDGSLDTSFGIDGKVITNFGGQEEVLAVDLQANGNILVTGRSTQGIGQEKLALARYKADGTLDEGFGVGGQIIADFFSVGTGLSGDGLNAAVFQKDGKVVAAGHGSFNESGFLNDFGAARYSDGALDSSFGVGGKVTTDFGGGHEGAFAIAVQLDGKVVAAGRTGSGDFALARYDVPVLPDFALGFNSTQVTVKRGKKIKIVLNVNRLGGFSGRVTVTPPDPSSIRIKIKPRGPVSTTETNITFKAKIKASAPTITHELVFTGVDESGRARSTGLTLRIQ